MKRNNAVTISGILVIVYAGIMSYLALTGRRFFSSGWFKDTFNLTIAEGLIPLHALCIVSAIGILLLKGWARRILLITYYFILGIYILAFGYSLVMQSGVTINVVTVTLGLIPALFIYFFTRHKVKEQFK